MNTDQNLLFGVLALQLEFIDIQQFAEACCVWAGSKDRQLAELLVERGWIEPAARDEVQRLLDRKVRRRQGDVRQALGDVADAQVRDVLHGVTDELVEQTLSHLEPLPGFVRVAETAAWGQAELSHYTLSRVHDQGGLGRVWLAFDKTLHRNVALKEIRPDRQPTEQALKRFVREAQITGQLEHPNIVPVYELARDGQRECPFYTMRFMQGQSLGDAIEAYHKQRQAGGASERHFQRLLQAFINICHAIAYAHSRRVIHRDLKPANVMLGGFGEVVVLDWGLAKLLDRPDELRPELAEAAAPILPPGTSEGVETLPGQILGTPAYMAPEQALCKVDEIDALTDVYGLGAILYRILTGRRPHPGRDSQERMRHAVQEPTPEPRAVDASVPRALNAICCKAMSAERLKRYLSARELAEDVQRFLADEPVRAMPDPWYVKARRWARRHAQLTVAAALFLVLTAVVATTALVITNEARQAANVARAEETRAKHQALGWLREAEQLIDVMATGVSSVLQDVGGAEGLRGQLLAKAAAAYERFSQVTTDDPELRLQAGHAQMRLGDICRLMHEFDRSALAYQRAHEVYASLSQHALAEAEPQLDAALSLRKLGDVRLDQRRYDQARTHLDEALTLVAGAPVSPRRQRQEVDLNVSWGLLEQGRENWPQAERWFREAIALTDSAAEDCEALRQRALAWNLLGAVLSRSRRRAEAMDCLRRACQTCTSLVQLEPAHPPYLEELAFSELCLAQGLMPSGEYAEEERLLQQAAQRFQELLQHVANFPHLRENRAIALTNLGLLYHRTRRNPEARQLLDAAVAEMQRLAAAPEATGRQFELLAQAHTIRGRILRDLDLGSDADAEFRKALDLFIEVLIPSDADTPDYQRGVATSGRHYAVQLERLGQAAEAEQEYATAIRLLEGLLEQTPQDLPTLDELAFCHEYRGDFWRRQQAVEKARPEYRRAAELREQLPDEPEYLARRIRVLLKLDAPPQEQAAALADRLAAAQPKHATYQTLKAWADYHSAQVDRCIATLESLADDDLTSAGAERLFLLALARCRRNGDGDRQRAREDFQQGEQWMRRHAAGDMALIELREQAARQLE